MINLQLSETLETTTAKTETSPRLISDILRFPVAARARPDFPLLQ